MLNLVVTFVIVKEREQSLPFTNFLCSEENNKLCISYLLKLELSMIHCNVLNNFLMQKCDFQNYHTTTSYAFRKIRQLLNYDDENGHLFL